MIQNLEVISPEILLKELKICGKVPDVDELVKKLLAIKVEYSRDDSYSSCGFFALDKKLMRVDDKLSRIDQRFAIAYLIARYQLGERRVAWMYKNEIYAEQDYNAMAYHYAVDLLISDITFDDEDIGKGFQNASELAKEYQVPEMAMKDKIWRKRKVKGDSV